MYKEKLIELFKTIPEIKEDLEELIDLKTKVIYYPNKWKSWPYEWIYWNLYERDDDRFYKFDITELDKIIWNPIEERHLRMYCKKNKIIYQYNNMDWILSLSWMDDVFDREFKEYDDTKSFDNQSEHFYKELYNFLINLWLLFK